MKQRSSFCLALPLQRVFIAEFLVICLLFTSCLFFYALVFRVLSLIAHSHSSFPVTINMTFAFPPPPLAFEDSDEMTKRQAASVSCLNLSVSVLHIIPFWVTFSLAYPSFLLASHQILVMHYLNLVKSTFLRSMVLFCWSRFFFTF